MPMKGSSSSDPTKIVITETSKVRRCASTQRRLRSYPSSSASYRRWLHCMMFTNQEGKERCASSSDFKKR